MRCPCCFTLDTRVAFRCVGSTVQATITCGADHISTWKSQPRCHGKPVSNILMCFAIVFSGGGPAKLLCFFDIMGVANIQFSQVNEWLPAPSSDECVES